MNIGDMIKDKLKIFEKREKELKKELTALYELRNNGQQIDGKRFKELHQELKEIRQKIKGFKKLTRNS